MSDCVYLAGAVAVVGGTVGGIYLRARQKEREHRQGVHHRLLGAADDMLSHRFRDQEHEDDDPAADYQLARANFDGHTQGLEAFGKLAVVEAAKAFRESCQRGDEPAAKADRVTLSEAVQADTGLG